MGIQSACKIFLQVIQSPIVQIIVALAALALFILRFGNAIREWNARRAALLLERSLVDVSGVSAYTRSDIINASRGYVEPNCTTTDPSEEVDLRNVVALAPIFRTVDNHLNLGGEKRHMILLADSGMGKTSFCINYYARDQRKGKSQRAKVAIIPLGASDPVTQINRIEDQADTVLFLDALDEDPQAADHPYDRLKSLMSAASKYKNIIVTCRSQFFESDERIPTGSGIMYAATRKAGVSREFPLHKLFLAPFDNEQINDFLKIHFKYTSWGNYKRRKRALSMVTEIPELSVRPMLLELVPDIIRENRFIADLFGLYDYLVESWLKRERDWITENDLRKVSIELAVVIYIQQPNGLGDRVSPSELDIIAKPSGVSIALWNLKTRSLLNRDIEGNFKFAHRSVMEFLFLLACLNGDNRCLTVEWTDLMKDLLVSLADTSHEFEERVTELFQLDLSKTRLFPLASTLALPRLLSLSECKKALRSEDLSSRRSRRIPLAWRNLRCSVERKSEAGGAISYVVNDSTHGISWLVNDIKDSADRDLYLDRFHEITQMELPAAFNLGQRLKANYRHPSIEELVVLWESEPHLVECYGIRGVFERDAVYWVGDKLNNAYLCCSFGVQPLVRSELMLIDKRSDKTGRRLFLYEVLGKFGMVNRDPYKAFRAYIIDEVSTVTVDSEKGGGGN